MQGVDTLMYREQQQGIKTQTVIRFVIKTLNDNKNVQNVPSTKKDCLHCLCLQNCPCLHLSLT